MKPPLSRKLIHSGFGKPPPPRTHKNCQQPVERKRHEVKARKYIDRHIDYSNIYYTILDARFSNE